MSPESSARLVNAQLVNCVLWSEWMTVGDTGLVHEYYGLAA